MRTNGIRGMLGILITLVALAGCSKGEAPSRFRTIDSHFGSAKMIADAYHNGVRRIGNDLDIDGDKMNDLYVLANDGTLYHTSSGRLVQGYDNARERTWIRNDPDMLKCAQKGTYSSP